MGFLLDKFEKLIIEHGSAAVRGDLIALLREQLLVAEKQMAKLETENAVLNDDNRKLRQQLGANRRLRWESPYYWLVSDDGTEEGPFCQRCHDKDAELIRLQGNTPVYRRGYWECAVCKNNFRDKNYNAADDVVLSSSHDRRLSGF
jgi:hypothetical protein